MRDYKLSCRSKRVFLWPEVVAGRVFVRGVGPSLFLEAKQLRCFPAVVCVASMYGMPYV